MFQTGDITLLRAHSNAKPSHFSSPIASIMVRARQTLLGVSDVAPG